MGKRSRQPQPPPQPLPDLKARRPWWDHLFLLLQVVVLYLVVRLPFYPLWLQAEEGINAALFVERPGPPKYCLWGRVDGQLRYGPMHHPAGCYETLRLAGFLTSPLVPNPPKDDSVVVPRLRLLFSLFQLGVWLGAALVIGREYEGRSRRFLLVLLGAVICSGTSIYPSVQVQVDGSVGSIMIGLLALAVVRLIHRPAMTRLRMALLGAAAFYLAWGKTEWSLALALALVVMAGHLLLRKFLRHVEVRGHLIALLVMAGGLILGNLTCALYDWENYRGSIALIQRVSPGSMPSGPGWGQRWARMFSFGFPFSMTAIGAVLLLLLVAVLDRKNLEPYRVFLIVLTLGLFVPFFLQTYYFEPRYLAPALVAATVACAGVFPKNLRLGGSIAAGVVLLALIGNDVRYLNNRMEQLAPQQTVAPDQAQAIRALNAQGFVPMLPGCRLWNKPDLDYFEDMLPPAVVDENLSKLGKKRWIPPR